MKQPQPRSKVIGQTRSFSRLILRRPWPHAQCGPSARFSPRASVPRAKQRSEVWVPKCRANLSVRVQWHTVPWFAGSALDRSTGKACPFFPKVGMGKLFFRTLRLTPGSASISCCTFLGFIQVQYYWVGRKEKAPTNQYTLAIIQIISV